MNPRFYNIYLLYSIVIGGSIIYGYTSFKGILALIGLITFGYVASLIFWINDYKRLIKLKKKWDSAGR